jgi:hypothetical protein
MTTTGLWYPICGRILVSYLWPHSGILFMAAFLYPIYGRIPKLILHLPHYNLSNILLSTVTIFCTSL